VTNSDGDAASARALLTVRRVPRLQRKNGGGGGTRGWASPELDAVGVGGQPPGRASVS
jgi:hypothetical protein